MYYEEIIINEVLHYRTHPRGKWTKMSPKKLTQMILNLQNK